MQQESTGCRALRSVTRIFVFVSQNQLPHTERPTAMKLHLLVQQLYYWTLQKTSHLSVKMQYRGFTGKLAKQTYTQSLSTRYYRKSEAEPDLLCVSTCVICDDREHVTGTVHEFSKIMLNFVKSFIPDLCKVIYFSQESTAQYKNC